MIPLDTSAEVIARSGHIYDNRPQILLLLHKLSPCNIAP